MLIEAHFLSVDEAWLLEPRQTAVAVSILDASEEDRRPTHLALFRDHLVLSFEDVYEQNSSGVNRVLWPDELSAAEHAQVTSSPRERAPVLSDAEKIISFVRKHHYCPERLSLFVHCHAGIGRSAAVAEWVAAAHRVPLPQLGDGVHSTDWANKRLLRLLDKASQRF